MKLRKCSICSVVIILLCVLILAACGTKDNPAPESDPEPPLGIITEEHGSAADYFGWWKLTEDSKDTPYAYILISGSDDPPVCSFDTSGALTDTAVIDYSEQRALNGGYLMVFTFDDTGEYGVSTWKSGGESYLDIGSMGEYIFDPSGEFDTLFARDYHFTLYNASDHAIASAEIGLLDAYVDGDVNILTSVLEAGQSVEVSGTIPGSKAAFADWTLSVTDTESNSSEYYYEFKLFDTTDAHIYWDAEAKTYYCEFSPVNLS